MTKRRCAALLTLLLTSQAAWGQTVVEISGILDAAVRYATNETGGHGGLTQVIGGGLSQSQLALRVQEDLGSGMKALAYLEHRIASDNGTVAQGSTSPAGGAAGFWALSYVGLQSPSLGRVTIGRQYNVLFDAVTFTPYSSFRSSPYINAYKPELAFALGARQDNLIKYTVASKGLMAEVAASPGEGNAIGGKSYGGMLRYNTGAVGVGGAYMLLEDGAGRRADGYSFGASFTAGALQLSAGWARNAFEQGFNPALINSFLGGTSIYGQAASTEHRDLFMLGFGYQLNPALWLGAHYWRGVQVGRTASADGAADFMAAVIDYALSKRTDLYAEIDGTRFHDGLIFPNGAQRRTGSMLGVRHRF